MCYNYVRGDKMKKIFKLLCFTFVLLTLTACGSKTELTEKQMDKILTEKGFLINDFSGQIEDKNVKTVKIATNKDYQIEYYIFKEEKLAKEAFTNNIKTFEDLNKTEGKTKNSDNYDKYTQKLSDTYNSLTRVGKMLVYASINIDYKSDFEKVIRALNY